MSRSWGAAGPVAESLDANVALPPRRITVPNARGPPLARYLHGWSRGGNGEFPGPTLGFSQMNAWRTVCWVGRDSIPSRAPAGATNPVMCWSGAPSDRSAHLASPVTARDAVRTRRRDDRAAVRFATRTSDRKDSARRGPDGRRGQFADRPAHAHRLSAPYSSGSTNSTITRTRKKGLRASRSRRPAPSAPGSRDPLAPADWLDAVAPGGGVVRIKTPRDRSRDVMTSLFALREREPQIRPSRGSTTAG